MFALMGDGIAAPQFAHDLDAFRKAGAAFRRVNAGDLEIGFELTTDTNPEDQAAIGQMIQCGDLFRDGTGVAQRQKIDADAQLQPRTVGGSLGQLDEGVENGDGKGQVIADP